MKKKRFILYSLIALFLITTGIVCTRMLLRNNLDISAENLRAKKYAQVNKGEEKISGTDYVTFDAYYLRDLDGDGYAEKLRGTCKEVGAQDALYMDLNVLDNGTLKNAKITINGKNFYLSTTLVKDSIVSKDYIGTNTTEIKLNDVVNGTQKLIFGNVRSGEYKTTADKKVAAIGNDTTKYSVADNTITLTGTHVADDGTPTEIKKVVTITNDWYGTSRADVSSSYNSQVYNINSAVDEKNGKINISFEVLVKELNEELILSKNHLEAEMPLLNGYAPTSVTATNGNVNYTYDEETRTFTAEVIASVNDRGVVTNTISRNYKYYIKAEYPLEAYTNSGENSISLNIPVETYYEGFNNPGTEFENPYKSNVAQRTLNIVYKQPAQRLATVNVSLGRYSNSRYVISKELPLNIYNQVETEKKVDDRYIVNWYVYTGTEIEGSTIKLKETPGKYTDEFLDTDGNYVDMSRYVQNVGIYFSNPSSLLGDEGYINVYNDETNELLHTFTKDDWTKYNGLNPYLYENGVKHIRVETSNVLNDRTLYIYNIKEIDDVLLTAEYEKEDFDKLSRIFSHIIGYKEDNGTETIINSYTNYAYYEEPYSEANITINPTYISNQETKKGVKINISTDTSSYNTKKWANGEFLIKYPEEIIDVNINSIKPSDSSIVITGVDTYEDNGNLYTKIYTANNIEKQIELEIDADITADPRKKTVSTNIEFYYYNPICHKYNNKNKDIYDVNGNDDIEEDIGYNSTPINIIAPLNLLTSQTATNFDDKESVVVAPQEATIDKIDGTKNANVNINITNNYSSTISEVKIVGKIPYKGNTYQLNKKDLESDYDTTMTSEGIVVPDNIKSYVTVYYSEKENVTDDINAKQNAWTTEPQNWSKVKSFLIDLGDYVMPVNNVNTFVYTIQIPNGIDYNKVTYSSHAVYYCLDTDQGKLKTQTEPNKLGFRVAEKYDLEITKYEINTTKPIQGVVFSAQEVGTEDNKTAISYSSGIAKLKNLYVEREYIIKEIKTADNYVLDETETRIIGHIVNGELQIDILDETNFKEEPIIEEQENANTKVKVVVENEVKYNFELNKTQTGTNEAIQGIKFELTDYNGKVQRYTTDKNGKLSIKLLEPYKQYTLSEVESKGHYLKDPVTFMMVRDENKNLKFNVLSGELDSLPVIDESGEVPVVKTGLTNEKIPTYSLRIIKKEKDTETTLKGAQFKLTGENKADSTLYTTDENGIIQIDNLYEYIEGRNVTGEYTLQEIYPSPGYVLDDTPIRFKAKRDATNNLKLEIQNGKIREKIEDIQVDNTDENNPVISITVDNSPVFTLTKVDAETGEPLEGVGFEIRDMNNDYVKDANGQFIGVKELGKIELYSTGSYAWTQNEDGTWQSGNYNMASSTSTLTSEEFTVDEKGIISFDWSVSSENVYDFVYYIITNLDTNVTIGGSTTQISGTSYGTVYKRLKYDEVEQEIEPGRYKIEFKYYKSYSTNAGLDRGFVKNVLLIKKENTIKTDSNGKIRLSLREGVYQAIETQPLEGYAKPEFSTGIGIGESRAAQKDNVDIEYAIGTKKVSFYDVTTVEDGVIAVANGGQVVKYDLDGTVIWENTEKLYSYQAVTAVEDGVIAVANGGQVVKYDLDGTVIWENTEKKSRYQAVTSVEDGVVAATYTGDVVKYGLDGTVMWENREISNSVEYHGVTAVEDGIIAVSNSRYIVKYGLDGTLMWQKQEQWYGLYGVTAVEDGFIAVGSSGVTAKYDLDGNQKWRKSESNGSLSYCGVTVVEDGVIAVEYNGLIQKYDFNGNLKWRKSLQNSNFYGVTCVENGVIAVGTSGQVVKYDLDGTLIWENRERSLSYNDATSVEGGFVAVATRGEVVKYDLDGTLMWKNIEKRYKYVGVTTVDDGVIAVADGGQVVKYNLDGTIMWENTQITYRYKAVTSVEDGVVAASDYKQVVKYDLDGNIVWRKYYESSSYCDFQGVTSVEDGIIAVGNNGQVVKFDLDGTMVWANTEKNYYYYGIVTVENGVIALGHNGEVVKYDLDGNIVWVTRESWYCYTGIIQVEDGFIGVGGQVVKFDFDGNKMWDNKDKTSSYYGSIAVEDGFIAVSDLGEVVKYKDRIVTPEIPSATNVIVKNEYMKFKITTKVDGYGGTITGKNEDPYEEVVWQQDSVKDIVATPSRGYKVQSITINGNPIDFIEDQDGTVTLDKFISVTEDKEIVVSFVEKNTSLVIRKQDSTNLNPLSGAIFNVKQIENREEPVTEQIVGDIVDNGAVYTKENLILGDKVEGALGELTNNGTYYFTEENGTYLPNNVGIDGKTANSYIKIDLTDYEGNYALIVNAKVSSESNYDYGYATITETTTAPTYDNPTGQFMKISGTTTTVTTPTDYIKSLEGGKVYYLHLGYRKDGSGKSGEDKLTINSVNIYQSTYETLSAAYNFIDNGNGGYESNNQGEASTTANSYIPIDLTDYVGKYKLIVNANVSSQSYYDYGYATVTETVTAPANNNYNGRFISISGTSASVTTPQDYSTVLDGGKMYYLHLGYYKDASTDSGEDKFTVNSIRLTLDTSDFLQDTEITTNSSGEAVISLVDGLRYQINEIQAPEGYTLNSEKIIYDFVAGEGNEITVTNRPQVDLIVHHYFKGTEDKVAEDEYIKGDLGKEYSTSPKTDLTDYRVVTKEDGSYDLPENASGLFQEETQVVTYYYEFKPLALIVHHYIDGTEDKLVDDEISEGIRGQEYTTNPITYPTLDEWYELVEDKLPANANGTLNDSVTEVTYYYKLKEHKITTEVQGKGGTISGQNSTEENPFELVPHGQDSKSDIIVTPDEGYKVSQITVNGELIEFTINEDGTVILDKFTSMLEDKHIVVTFEIKRVEYLVTKIWDDDENAAGKRPGSIEVELYGNGSLVDSKLITNENLDVLKQEEELDFVNIEGQAYPWSRNADGTWQSGNYNRASTTSTLQSNDFDLPYGGVLSFDWSVSSENNYDYLYYTITNLNTNQTIGGNMSSTKITGTSYGNVYEDLIFNTVNVNLEQGRYKIEFTYYKDSSQNNGLDRGFVKNLRYNYEYFDNTKWRGTFESIPVLDDTGEKINYTVVEKEVNEKELVLYTSNIEYSEDNPEVTITNTFNIPNTTIDMTVTKQWIDNSNENELRPNQIKLQLKNGEEVVQEKIIDTNDGDEQTCTFTDLIQYNEQGNEIEYTIDEAEVNEGDFKFYSKAIDNPNNTIINTYTVPEDKISLEVTKKWEDSNNENGVRPSQLKIQVKNGDEVVQDQIIDITGENEQKCIFENLLKYNSRGREIKYTVDEVEVNENDLIAYSKSIDAENYVITNTIAKHNITTQVNGNGGTISGQNDNPYEEVVRGQNSTKDIIITPEEGYEISKITINEIEQTLPEFKTQEYTLPTITSVTEDEHVVVEFKKREYNITTEVEGIGGTISGQGEEIYETVVHGENSIKDIVVTPNRGYKILTIKVNGEEIEFTELEDGTYILEKFVGVTENKEVDVIFEKQKTSILIKHVTEEGENLRDPEIVNGTVGDEYITNAVEEFEEYELKTTPDNAEGIMTEKQIEIVYVYSLVKGKITITKVDNKDMSIKLSRAIFRIERLDNSGNIDETFAPIEIETNREGIVEFKNLTVGTYEITEIVAPEGYELAKKTQKVEVTKENKEINMTIKNKKKLTLPATGKINYAIGISLVGFAIISISIILSKKKAI